MRLPSLQSTTRRSHLHAVDIAKTMSMLKLCFCYTTAPVCVCACVYACMRTRVCSSVCLCVCRVGTMAAYNLRRVLSTISSPRANIARSLPALQPHVSPAVKAKGTAHVNRFSVCFWMDHFSKHGLPLLAGCMTMHDPKHELFADLPAEKLRDVTCTLCVILHKHACAPGSDSGHMCMYECAPLCSF